MKGFARQGWGINSTELQNNSKRFLQLWPPTVRQIQQEGFLDSPTEEKQKAKPGEKQSRASTEERKLGSMEVYGWRTEGALLCLHSD